ncbi:hypothetical protein ACIQNI_00070 [Streptomyces sp. NPDC091266]|uniref:hypothetical protein n=1 Tax=Streptomyces sp. NPDC091266 TaxID=3365978 RepID=UPI00382244B7
MLYVAAHRHANGQDHVALVEIDLIGELMIAAAAASEDRLSPDRIDELLDVEVDAERESGGGRGVTRSAPSGRG